MKIILPSLAAALALTLFMSPACAQTVNGFIVGAGMPTAFPEFDAAAIPAWWLSCTFMDCPAGVFGIFIFSLLASLLFFLADAANRRADDGGVLGEARVKTGAEVIRGSETWDGKSEPKSRGYVYGFTKGRYLYESKRHVLTCGQTGSGKTRFQNIPTLDLLTFGEGGDNVIVSDVKMS